MKNILFSIVFLLFGFSMNAQITFGCVVDGVTTMSKCDDCGGAVTKATFTGVRFKRNGVTVKEISYPFDVFMMSTGFVCVEESGNEDESFCFGASQTPYTYPNDLFVALQTCNTTINGTGGVSDPSIISNKITGNQIATHTSGDGTVENINETITSMVLDPAKNIWTYANEAGQDTTIYYDVIRRNDSLVYRTSNGVDTVELSGFELSTPSDSLISHTCFEEAVTGERREVFSFKKTDLTTYNYYFDGTNTVSVTDATLLTWDTCYSDLVCQPIDGWTLLRDQEAGWANDSIRLVSTVSGVDLTATITGDTILTDVFRFAYCGKIYETTNTRFPNVKNLPDGHYWIVKGGGTTPQILTTFIGDTCKQYQYLVNGGWVYPDPSEHVDCGEGSTTNERTQVDCYISPSTIAQPLSVGDLSGITETSLSVLMPFVYTPDVDHVSSSLILRTRRNNGSPEDLSFNIQANGATVVTTDVTTIGVSSVSENHNINYTELTFQAGTAYTFVPNQVLSNFIESPIMQGVPQITSTGVVGIPPSILIEGTQQIVGGGSDTLTVWTYTDGSQKAYNNTDNSEVVIGTNISNGTWTECPDDVVNIYNTDGTLTGNRILDGDGNTRGLTLTDLSSFNANATEINFTSASSGFYTAENGALFQANNGNTTVRALNGQLSLSTVNGELPINIGAAGTVSFDSNLEPILLPNFVMDIDTLLTLAHYGDGVKGEAYAGKPATYNLGVTEDGDVVEVPSFTPDTIKSIYCAQAFDTIAYDNNLLSPPAPNSTANLRDFAPVFRPDEITIIERVTLDVILNTAQTGTGPFNLAVANGATNTLTGFAFQSDDQQNIGLPFQHQITWDFTSTDRVVQKDSYYSFLINNQDQFKSFYYAGTNTSNEIFVYGQSSGLALEDAGIRIEGKQLIPSQKYTVTEYTDGRIQVVNQATGEVTNTVNPDWTICDDVGSFEIQPILSGVDTTGYDLIHNGVVSPLIFPQADETSNWTIENITDATFTIADSLGDKQWRANGADGQAITINNAAYSGGNRMIISRGGGSITGTASFTISGGSFFNDGANVVSPLVLNPGDNYTITKQLGNNWDITSKYPNFELPSTVSFSETGKVATFTGDIDVTGTIDPDGLVFSDNGNYTDVTTAQAYFEGKGLDFSKTVWINPEDGELYRGGESSETNSAIVNSTSSRVGDYFYAPAGSTVQGYLPVQQGTVTNGAIDYPIWAALNPWFISGNDIVFPADVEGAFLRNLGGNSLAEGTIQGHRTALPSVTGLAIGGGGHTHAYNDDRLYDYSMEGSNIGNGTSVLPKPNSIGIDSYSSLIAINESGAEGLRMRLERVAKATDATGHSHTVTGGDVETNPINFSLQLYTIVDNYNQLVEAGMLSTQENLKFKYDNTQATDIVTNSGGNTTFYTSANIVTIPLLNSNVTKNINNLFTIDEVNNAIEFLQNITGDLTIEIDAFDLGGTDASLFDLYIGDLTQAVKRISRYLPTSQSSTLQYVFRDESFTTGQKLDFRFGNIAGENLSVRGIRIYFESAQQEVINTTDVQITNPSTIGVLENNGDGTATVVNYTDRWHYLGSAERLTNTTDTTSRGYPILTEFDGATIQTIELSTHKDLGLVGVQLNALLYTPSINTYTSLGQLTLQNGNTDMLTLSTVVTKGQYIYFTPIVVGDPSWRGLDMEITFSK